MCSVFSVVKTGLSGYCRFARRFLPQTIICQKLYGNIHDGFWNHQHTQQRIFTSPKDHWCVKEEGKENKELYIAVKSGEQSVEKTISELRSFQILRLYEIYIEEQMNLHTLKSEDENEKNTIDQEREMRLKRWDAVRSTIDRDELSQKAKSEQAGKMEDLMGKL